MATADIIASFLGYGLLHLRGHFGLAGWRWLFLIEVRHQQRLTLIDANTDSIVFKGLLTFCVGMVAFALMPPGPCESANWIRGAKGWFTER